ncbi:MAG: YbaB/EbfC family nucleoid-associated protein [Patescibacteria group bacterium]
MLGNLKDIYQLQAKARDIQKKLAEEIIEVEKNGIKIRMNGKQEILSIELNDSLSKQEQEELLKEAFNNAVRQVQQLMAKKLML